MSFKTRISEHKINVTVHHQQVRPHGDHTTTENHLIDLEGVNVVDRESHRRRSLMKEAIWMRKTNAAINRDEGNYELPHVYDDVVRRH